MLRRLLIVSASAVTICLACAAPAFANGWGNVDCTQAPSPDCQLGAGSDGSGAQGGGQGKPNPQPGRNSGSGRSSSGTGDGTADGGGASSEANCSYTPSNYQPPPTVSTAAYRTSPKSSEIDIELDAVVQPMDRAVVLPKLADASGGSQQGSWYLWQCSGNGAVDGAYHLPVWIPNGPQGPGAAPAPSPAQLAQMARNQLQLPTPSIAANPAGEQLVNLPTWMWLSNGWRPVSATASVPGVSVTATATPTSVVWSMGDGSTVTCTGAGTPFPPGTAPTASSPDCGHTYRSSSASQAGQAFPVTATVHWTVTWVGAGQGGVFPDLTTTGNAAFRVAESQALNNGG